MTQSEPTRRRIHLTTVPEAAKHFAIDVRTLRAAIRAGRLPAYTLGGQWTRVDLEEVEEWIRSTRIGAGQQRGDSG